MNSTGFEDFKYCINLRGLMEYINSYGGTDIPLLIKLNYLSIHQFMDEELKVTNEEIQYTLNELIEKDEKCVLKDDKIIFHLNCKLTQELIDYIDYVLRLLFLIPLEYQLINDKTIEFTIEDNNTHWEEIK